MTEDKDQARRDKRRKESYSRARDREKAPAKPVTIIIKPKQ